MEPIVPNPEFFFPGTFEVEPPYREGNEQNLHQGGLDGIDPAFDFNHDALTGIIGFDPADYVTPSLETRGDIESELPQWGPPFIKFVDGRISELEKNVKKEIDKWQFQTQTVLFSNSQNTDGTGGLNMPLYQGNIPPGFTFALHRLGVFLPDANLGFNFGNPRSNANGYYEIRVDNEAIDGGSLVPPAANVTGGTLPFVRTWGTRDAPHIRDGENLSLFMFSTGLASVRFLVKGQGSYDRTIEG